MRSAGVLLVLSVLFLSLSVGRTEDGTPSVEAAAEDVVVSNRTREDPMTHEHRLEETPAIMDEPTVASSLARVWTKFGDVATSLYKIRFIPDKAEGRGNRLGKMAIPLIIGFKIAGAIIAGLAALKVLIMKTFAMSSIALIVSLAVGAKYIYDKIQKPIHDETPYHYIPELQEVGWNTGYEVIQPAHLELNSDQQSTDLQGHHSTKVAQIDGDSQATYAVVQEAAAPAQRKHFRGSPKYRTIGYRKIYRAKG